MVATEQSGEKEASTLRQEHAALQEQNRLLQTEVISLRQQAHYHRTQHQRAVQRAQELEAQVGVLKAKVAGLQQRLFGRKSERVSRASPSGAAGEESGIGRRARGQQPGSAGHGRKLRKKLPVVETVLDLCEQQKRCPRCGLVWAVAEKPVHKPGMWGTYMDAVYPGKAIIEGGQTSTGSVIAWFKRNFAPDTSFEELNAAASALEPGAEGLVVLDHFQGNRTPYTDAASRGAITGLTLKHTASHVFRAIMESICLGTRLIIDSFGEAFSAKRIVVAGGATNSPLWLQIHADTIGVPLELTEVPDAPALGCAILAAYGTGRFATIEEGCKAMVRRHTIIEPDRRRTQLYEREVYPRYGALYGALKSVRDVR